MKDDAEKTVSVPMRAETFGKLSMLGLLENDVRGCNVGGSDYSRHVIQPWSIWIDHDLNPFDADIVKRVLRRKDEGGMSDVQSRIMDYKKIIHVCRERIRQLSWVENKGFDFLKNE